MCVDPATLIAIGSSLMGGFMSAQQASTQAAILDRQAENEEISAAYEADRAGDRQQRLLGDLRAGVLSNGLVLEGSMLDVVGDNTIETELDIAAIKYGGAINAENLRMQASMKRQSGQHSMIGGFIGAMSPMITSAKSFGTNYGAGTRMARG
ncbi:MAG: hypothetical protein JKY10_00630 [Cohaesibacteraceae bacterium]|nr:hypothetical protein [Cohaesibacteraceae bacterium]